MIHMTKLSVPLGLAAVTLALAGCGGGGGKTPAASGGGSGPEGGDAAAYKFSRCMRSHGVADFPDPKIITSPGQVKVAIHVTPGLTSSPAFKSAQKACGGIMGGPGTVNPTDASPAQLHGLISFASCMRTHQVPTFPDPTAQGHLSMEMLAAANIDLKAPAVRAAALACVPASDGALTKAQVEQALAVPSSASGSSSGAG